jgi:hypothetical protein
MIVAPVLVCVAPLLAGWLLGVVSDVGSLVRPKTSLQLFVSVGAVFFPFAAFMAARGCWNEARARASVGWPTVAGRVERSQAEYGTSVFGGYWRLALAYRYAVGGRDYQGHRVQFGPQRFAGKDIAERLARKFQEGAEVLVHYDPNDPVTAVLDTSDEIAWEGSAPTLFFLAAPFIFGVLYYSIGGV